MKPLQRLKLPWLLSGNVGPLPTEWGLKPTQTREPRLATSLGFYWDVPGTVVLCFTHVNLLGVHSNSMT